MSASPEPADPRGTAAPSWREAVRVWAKIGVLGFGGPAGQIALMHRELVERRRWIDEVRFMHALDYCMLLPGPEAQQLATYVGWLLHRTAGAVIAGVLFVLPGALVVLALSWLYAAHGATPWLAAAFFGLKAAVLALIVEALLRIGRRVLRQRAHWLVALAAFVALAGFAVPFPLVVVGAAVVGATMRLPGATRREGAGVDGTPTVVDAMAARGELGHTRPDVRRAARVLVVCLLLWLAPVVVVAAIFGGHSVWVQQAALFSQAAVVTFGGAYAVLAWIAQRAVAAHGWLQATEMLDGLALAETTPGPLILVVEFVAFVAAYRTPAPLQPLWAAVLGAGITLWVTFVPCFLWILLGAPWLERVRTHARVASALSAITAAVVGVIAQLALSLTLQVWFARVDTRSLGPARIPWPAIDSVDPWALLATATALLAVLRLRLRLGWVLAGAVALGLMADWLR